MCVGHGPRPASAEVRPFRPTGDGCPMRRGSSSGRAPWRPCGRRSRLAAPQRCRRRDRGPPTRARALGHAPALQQQQRHDCAEAIVRRRLDQVERVGGHQRASGPRTTFGAALRSTGLDALSSRTTACSSTWYNVTLTSATVPDGARTSTGRTANARCAPASAIALAAGRSCW